MNVRAVNANAGQGGVVLVAPFFDEEKLIEEFLRRTAAIARQVNLIGLVLVDDGSRDQTCERVATFARQNNTDFRIRLIRLSRNFGHQNAVMAGLAVAHAWALDDRIEYVALIDTDLQDRPEHLPVLAAALPAYDVVYAVREFRSEGWAFRISACLFYQLLGRFSRVPIPTNAGTFCIMRTSFAGVLLANADAMPYFPGLRAWIGYRQKGEPLARDARLSGQSRVRWSGLVRLGLNALFAYSSLPVLAIGVVGAVALVISIVAASVMTILKIAGLVEVQGTAIIIISVFFSLGIQSIYVLALTRMIGRIAADSSRRKPYLVMEDHILR